MKTKKKFRLAFKKAFSVMLAVLLLCSLAACGNNGGTSSGGEESESPANDAGTSQSVEDGGTAPDRSQTENNGDSSKDGNTEMVKVLVAYFSATNTTEGVAQTISDSLNADLYEITPEQPYTDADLDYHDDESRSTIEMNDPDARPAISGSVENMEEYDIVFVGYPIWWGEAPRILNTFVESYDFSGKTIVPFCTSGGSGMGSSAENLEDLTSGATWLSGTRLNGGASHDFIVEWINGLGLDITAQ